MRAQYAVVALLKYTISFPDAAIVLVTISERDRERLAKGTPGNEVVQYSLGGSLKFFDRARTGFETARWRKLQNLRERPAR